MKLHVAAALFFGAQSSVSASDTGVLLVNGSIKKRHLATNETETSSRREQRQERLEKFREKLAEGKGKFHHGGNYTNGRINNVTLAQVAQPSFAKEEEDDPLFGCPQEDIVVCVNGMSGGDTSRSCADKCDGKCCVGDDACDGFTGRVCKDGLSCTGGAACKDADIDLVVGGCRGEKASTEDGPKGVCENADIKRGVIRGCIGDGSCSSFIDVGRIKDGCVGEGACAYLGAFGGYVGFVDNGCVERYSCRYTGNGGRVGFIRNACKGRGSCKEAGRFGFVGFIENSCTGIDACEDAGRGANNVGSGGIGSIEHSCHDDFACVEAGRYGTISSIKWSCKGKYSCAFAASGNLYKEIEGGYIDGINKACLGDRACLGAAKYGGYINGISKACLTDSSCFYAARDDASIDSGIKNCVCDTCAGALDDASLPDECGDKLDFGELLNELEDIIKSKIGN